MQKNKLLVHAVACSGDSKTGPIPVAYISEDASCPDSCPLKNGPCYARFYNVGRVWKRLNNGDEGIKYLSWDRFCAWVAALPSRISWRYGVAGDLPHTGDGKTIDREKLDSLVKVNNKGKKNGFAYTHHKPDVPGNAEAIKSSNEKGFTVNLSADGLNEADELFSLGIAPVATIMPRTEGGYTKTPNGVKVLECLATNPRSKAMNCVECGFVCAMRDRKFIVGFVPHGVAKKSAERIMQAS